MIVKNYINKTTLETVLQYAIDLYKPKNEVVFIPTTKYRKRETILNIPQEIFNIKEKIISEFTLNNYSDTLDIFFNVLAQNQKVSKHSHKKHEDKHDLRFNIMLQKSEFGGVPECDGVKLYLQNGDMWIFDGCKDHETDLVRGKTTRYVISYGFIVEEKIIKNILSKRQIYYL